MSADCPVTDPGAPHSNGVPKMGSSLPSESGAAIFGVAARPRGNRRSADGRPSKNATVRQHCITRLQGLRSTHLEVGGSGRSRRFGRSGRNGETRGAAAAALARHPACRSRLPQYRFGGRPCVRAMVDTPRAWGILEKVRDYGRFGDFPHPPTGSRSASGPSRRLVLGVQSGRTGRHSRRRSVRKSRCRESSEAACGLQVFNT